MILIIIIIIGYLLIIISTTYYIIKYTNTLPFTVAVPTGREVLGSKTADFANSCALSYIISIFLSSITILLVTYPNLQKLYMYIYL